MARLENVAFLKNFINDSMESTKITHFSNDFKKFDNYMHPCF